MPTVERRIGLLFVVFLALMGVAALRAAWLGTVKADTLKNVAATQQVSNIPVPAPRGTITDRQGTQLAVSEAADDVAVTPYLVKDPQRVAERIAPWLGVPAPSVLGKLVRRGSGFVYLARLLPEPRATRIAQMKIPGIQLIPGTRRLYPQSWTASQVLGAVGTDGNGLAGLEYSQDRRLRGQTGARRVVRDAVGHVISLQDSRRSRAGRPIQLTLDASIQQKVEQVLQGVGGKFSPKGATAVVMDPRSGAILAMGNWPRVDANAISAAPDYARQNRAVGASYEPGSTFKAFTVAGALEDHKVTPDTSFNLAPQIQVADRKIGESHDRGWITLTTAGILAQSSNVGAVTIGLRDGAANFSRWVSAFGFGHATGVDLPGEQTGIVPALKDYSGSSMGNLPIGQGLAVTPLQMATGYAAIANGGMLPHPHVLARVGGHAVREPRSRRAISPATAASLRTMLEGVLAPGGTAQEVSIPGYQLAGKTGTANKPDPATGGYSKTKFVASFVGFAPARDPKVLVAVMVDEPQGDIYGATVAAPAFEQIMSYVLPYLGIPPS